MESVREIPMTTVENDGVKARSSIALADSLASRLKWAEPPPPDPVMVDQVETAPVTRVTHSSRQPSLPASMDVAFVDEPRSTDDSSSQASSSLKLAPRRAGDMSAHFRQRVRQQAKQMVEKKRGSAQLARRLQRSRSLQSQYQPPLLDAEDDVQVDKRIEESIKLGAKYTRKVHSVVPPEHIQQLFFYDKTTTSNFVDDESTAITRVSTTMLAGKTTTLNIEAMEVLPTSVDNAPFTGVVHARPRFPKKSSVEAFLASLATDLRRSLIVPIVGEETHLVNYKDPLFNAESILFAACPKRDISSMLRHMGQNFLLNQGQDILGFEEFTTNRLFHLVHDDDDYGDLSHDNVNVIKNNNVNTELLSYRCAIDFDDEMTRANFNRNARFSRLHININRVEFEHHWLYTPEDAAARALRTAFELYNSGIDALIALIRDYLRTQQQQSLAATAAGIDDISKAQPVVDGSSLDSLANQIESQKNILMALSRTVEDAWQHLQQVRIDALTGAMTRTILQKSEYAHSAVRACLENRELPEMFYEIMKLPSFTLGEDVNATRPRANIAEERAAALRRCRIQLEIYFNEILVCTTDDVSLSADTVGGYSAIFGRVYRLHVAEPPREICVRVRERFGAVIKCWNELARIFLPLNSIDSDASLERVDINVKANRRRQSRVSSVSLPSEEEVSVDSLHTMQFASEVSRERYKGSLGCGAGAPFLSGTLYYSAVWLDTENAAHYERRQLTLHSTLKFPSYKEFSLIPKTTMLCSEEEFQSVILRQIEGRKCGSPAQLTRQLSVKSRSGASVSEFFGGVDEFSALLSSSGSGNELGLDAYRRIGHAYAILIRRHLVENFALEQRLKSYSEIVHEESLPILFRTFGTLFTPPDLSRKLKPMRLPSTATRAQQTIRSTYRLVVNIQSATNLPERLSGEPTCVFAEVAFQKSYARTTVVEGHFANWQETIILELDTNACMTGNHAQQIFEPRAVMDAVQLDIFDQIVTPLEFDDREPNTFHKQVKNVWMGSIRIPFSTIYSLTKVDSAVTLNRPLFTAGYRIPEQSRHSSVKLMICIDPPLVAPLFSSYESFECGETDERIFVKAKKWELRMRSAFPDRRVVALANDTNGKRVLVPRFLCKIMPPNNIVSLAETNLYAAISACIDLVASIPLVEDSVLFPGVCDVWTSAFEILKIGCGTAEEKAILLTCWLKGLNVDASLLLGWSLPEGLRSAYVYVKFEHSMNSASVSTMTAVLINPTNTNYYLPNDSMVPLNVGTIVTTQNVYTNVQRDIHPSLIDFDFRKRALWEPLFANDRSDLISIQTDVIRYVNVSEDLLTELRTTLEREIKLHFDEARQFGIPQWNLLASRTLRDILQDLWTTDVFMHDETQSRPPGRLIRDQPLHVRFNATINVEARLNALRASYGINASAFCCAYTSKRDIIERVMKLRAHLYANVPQMQYALAVHVYAFVNQLVSVNVALAVLTPLCGSAVPSSVTPWATAGPSFSYSQRREHEK